jgi:hypothetical protein
MLHQQEVIFVNHMSQLENLTNWIWKTRKETNLVHIVKKILFRQIVPILPWLVLTSFVDIETDDILKLDQWNHVDVLDVKEIMYQTKLHVIKFDRPRGLKKKSRIISISISMHKAMNKNK